MLKMYITKKGLEKGEVITHDDLEEIDPLMALAEELVSKYNINQLIDLVYKIGVVYEGLCPHCYRSWREVRKGVHEC